ncbi:MAG TPA: cation-translocating P-type ATPase [Solimonas sp.]|nr:cation-translocating P-type ATPase [Solimonas sp.]
MGTDWQVYDRPDLLAAVTTATDDPGGEREALLAVEGLHCASCAQRIERLLADQARRVRVNLSARTVDFLFSPARAPLSSIIARLADAGFVPQVLAQTGGAGDEARRQRRSLARIGIAALGSMQVMMLAWPLYFDAAAIDAGTTALLRWSQWLLATPVLFYSGWPFLEGAWRSLATRSLGMDVPVALSILIAYTVSAVRTVAGAGELYFDAATMFVLLLGTGRYLEGRTRTIAGARLRLLASRRPLTAERLDGDIFRSVPIASLVPGDCIRVAPGAAIPVDGELLAEPARLDESLLTGESRPVAHQPGDRVLGGSLNAGLRPLCLRATDVGARTRLAQIERLLREAQATRPPVQQLADRIAGHFVLVVLVLAAAGLLAWWPYDPDRALGVLLAVLVASCPCALSLAIPAVHAAASAKLAGLGVLLARPEALARLQRVDTVLFDKTGTLTRPALELVEFRAMNGADPEQVRQLAAALEHGLNHPVARALARAGTPAAQDVSLDPAGGVEGEVDGRRYWIGTARAEADPAIAEALARPDRADHTWLMLCEGIRVLALFGLVAPIRTEARIVIARLQARGLSVELLSGDRDAPVAGIASGLGIARARAHQSPEDKLARLRELQAQGRVVMAVGDGINDAPFLAAADVAVAMPAGDALAQARADAILTGDRLDGLLRLLDIGRTAHQRSRENLTWALAYNLAIMPLALGGALLPWMAALGMSLSSLLVVGNALRLRSRKLGRLRRRGSLG